jgi:hypothetical protein
VIVVSLENDVAFRQHYPTLIHILVQPLVGRVTHSDMLVAGMTLRHPTFATLHTSEPMRGMATHMESRTTRSQLSRRFGTRDMVLASMRA